MLTAKTKLEFLQRFKDACIPEDVFQDKQYPTAYHVILPWKPEIQTDKIVWSGSCQWIHGDPKVANSPDATWVWAAVSFIQRTDTGEKQVGQILFPGSWALQVYNKWLILWYKGTNFIRTAHERYGLAPHRLVNRERGLLLARHENLDETIGTLIQIEMARKGLR